MDSASVPMEGVSSLSTAPPSKKRPLVAPLAEDRSPEILSPASSDGSSVSSPRVFGGPLCDVCGETERRYCCPRCGVLTCSLACCQQHKAESGCSGRRDRTGYVALKAFGEPELRSDFHFLEDAALEVDRAKRAR